jgi:hypothetical protein
MFNRKLVSILAGLGLAASVAAQTTAPIKVAIFRGVGSSNYWHDCINTAITQITTILSDPANATNIRDKASMVIPPQGFSVRVFGAAGGSGAAARTPTAAQVTEFINYLDTADVVLILCNVRLFNAISDATQRQKLADFWMAKGGVSLHATTDSYGAWAPFDTIQAARFDNHTSNQNTLGTLYKDTISSNVTAPGFNALNLGLWELGDTTRFAEEWFSFLGTSSAIRAKSQLRVLMTVKEASYGSPGSFPAMGTDHPMAWFRNFTNGGRYFYSAVGHRYQNYTGVSTGTGAANQTTDFFRRQIYNAIVWAAKYDGPVSIRRDLKAPGSASSYSKLAIAGSSLTVSLLRSGEHEVNVMTLNGKRVTSRTGSGEKAYTFDNLRSGVYVIAVTTPQGRSNRIATVR